MVGKAILQNIAHERYCLVDRIYFKNEIVLIIPVSFNSLCGI
jgi:hypothetical protein